MTNSEEALAPAEAVARPKGPKTKFIPQHCIRQAGAECERCMKACPAAAISFDGDQFAGINEETCTRCGICWGICDAFSATKISLEDVYKRMQAIARLGERPVITCRPTLDEDARPAKNVIVLPCLALIPPEFWARALAEELPFRVCVELKHCLDCETAKGYAEILYTHSIKTAECWAEKKITFIRNVPQVDPAELEAEQDEESNKRRALTNVGSDVADIYAGKRSWRASRIVQQLAKSRAKNRQAEQVREKQAELEAKATGASDTERIMGTKRSMLLHAARAAECVGGNALVTVSQTECNECKIDCACALACPTKARMAVQKPGAEQLQLAYDRSYCIGCGLCQQACTQEAISMVDVAVGELI